MVKKDKDSEMTESEEVIKDEEVLITEPEPEPEVEIPSKAQYYIDLFKGGK